MRTNNITGNRCPYARTVNPYHEGLAENGLFNIMNRVHDNEQKKTALLGTLFLDSLPWYSLSW
jgi:hypothetical protein